jgi:membrane-associated phospholipid phosphatase
MLRSAPASPSPDSDAGDSRAKTPGPGARLAYWTSVALVPPTISAAAYGALVVSYEDGDPFRKAMVWLLAILFTGVIQIAYVLHLKHNNKVAAYDVPDRLQRTKPYLLSIALSLTGLAVLAWMHASPWVLALTWCFAINTALLTAINRYWKISAHMMGLTGPLVFLMPLAGAWILLALPLLVLLGWARIRLRAHTPGQVLAGAAAGIVFTAGQIAPLLRWGLLPGGVWAW